MKKIICLTLILMAMLTAPATASDKAAINQLLDGFHAAAAQADKDRYLGYFTKDGVFMGTDDWERWPLQPDFEKYVAERFKGSKGWTYISSNRQIAFAPGHKTAWFDEIMTSEKWGRFRGTGVLLKGDEGWKLAHYSLTMLVANEAFVTMSEINRAAILKRDAGKQ